MQCDQGITAITNANETNYRHTNCIRHIGLLPHRVIFELHGEGDDPLSTNTHPVPHPVISSHLKSIYWTSPLVMKVAPAQYPAPHSMVCTYTLDDCLLSIVITESMTAPSAVTLMMSMYDSIGLGFVTSGHTKLIRDPEHDSGAVHSILKPLGGLSMFTNWLAQDSGWLHINSTPIGGNVLAGLVVTGAVPGRVGEL